LGGYLAYHNITLFNYFLALFAAVQGARLIRHLEESGDINLYLSASTSRSKLIFSRSFAYFLAQILISLGLGIGTALALSASNETATSAAIITLLAGGIAVLPVFGLALIISQFVRNARTASSITAIIVTTLYVINNIADKFYWLEPIKYLTPFYYANLSRPVIPEFSANYSSWLIMLAVAVLFVLIANQIFISRDIAGTPIKVERKNAVRKLHIPKGFITDILWRQRFGLVAWAVTSGAFIGVFISLMSGIVEIWEEFAFLQQFSASGFGTTAQEQYLAMVYEMLPPFVAGFLIQQGSKWTSDLNEGRVQLFISSGISKSGLVFKRMIAGVIGCEVIILTSLLVATFGSVLQDAPINAEAMIRVLVIGTLFALAFSAIVSLLVSMLAGRNPTQLLSIYVGAAWMISFMVPYLDWPNWLLRLSIFDAFGHPYVDWPSDLNFVTIFGAIVLGIGGSLVMFKRSDSN
jgi:ABC-2 type transport system permease protein